MIGWFHVIRSAPHKFVQRHRLLSFASFLRHRAPVFTDEKMFERRQQIRTQSSFLFANSIEVPALQQQRKKSFGLDLLLPLVQCLLAG